MMGPCENPSCKSYGKPHPNCRCHADMAEGGEAGFCSSHRIHDSSCRYHVKDHDETFKNLERPDPQHHYIGYLAHGGFAGLHDIDHENYQHHAKRGHKTIDSHVSSVFEDKKIDHPDLTKKRNTVEDWLDKGGIHNDIQQEMYQQNSPQQPLPGQEPDSNIHTPMATELPEHNLMMQATKASVGNYLQSLKPNKNQPKLAFDPEPDQREQQKSYKKALDIALHPMSVMREIQKGTIEPEDLSHLQAMYPEFHDHLQKKATEKIIEAQLSGKKPSYKVRQGLSMLLGTPLSSEMTPQNIQAAQATFAMQGAPQQAGPAPQKAKKSTTALSKSSQSFLTGNQSLVGRSQRQK